MNSRSQFMNPADAWVPPSGLDRSRPRDVSLTATGVITLLLVGVLALGAIAAGIGLTALASRQAEEARLLRQEGLTADGRIVKLWRSRDKNRRPWAAYQFTHEEQAFERNSKIPYAIWKNLKVGTSYPVRYFPGRPELSHLEGLALRPLPMWVPIPISCALVLGGFMAVLPVRRQRTLLMMGRPAAARITSHGKRHRSSKGSDLGVYYAYEFLLLNGSVSKGLAGPAKNPPAIGSVVPIIYDPDRPQRNAPYPFSLVRLNLH
jgi:hypothetical protein